MLFICCVSLYLSFLLPYWVIGWRSDMTKVVDLLFERVPGLNGWNYYDGPYTADDPDGHRIWKSGSWRNLSHLSRCVSLPPLANWVALLALWCFHGMEKLQVAIILLLQHNREQKFEMKTASSTVETGMIKYPVCLRRLLTDWTAFLGMADETASFAIFKGLHIS